MLLSPLLAGFISVTFAVGQWTDLSQSMRSCSSFNEQLLEQLQRMQAQLDAITASTRQLVNLALHRPAWQSSLYGPYNASLAVDGNVDTYQHTDHDDWSPWWAVDLGKPMNVHLVNVINSRDCCPPVSSLNEGEDSKFTWETHSDLFGNFVSDMKCKIQWTPHDYKCFAVGSLDDYRSRTDTDRLDNIVVGLTNNPPRIMSPLTHGYATCGKWYGSAPKGRVMPVQCSTHATTFRYVVVFGTKQHFQMAEVEVYAK